MDKLDPPAIAAALAPLEVRVVPACASTNAELLAGEAGAPALLIADHQSRGRGRRGRRWYSAPGDGLLLSLGHRVGRPLRELPGLSLAAGVAALRALRGLGLAQVELKWPNDLLAGGAKLGGILVETRVRDGAAWAVIGIGINWHAAPGGSRLRRDAVCVAQLVNEVPSRTSGAHAVATELLRALREFDTLGLDAFRAEWEAAHAHAGQRVRVRLSDGRVVSGTADGIGADGSLRLRTRRGVRDIHTGTLLVERTRLPVERTHALVERTRASVKRTRALAARPS